MKFCFGDIVIVENYLIGVICKSWIKNNKEIYNEDDIHRYMVRHKELNEEEMEYQKETEHPFVTDEEVKEFLNKLNLDNI